MGDPTNPRRDVWRPGRKVGRTLYIHNGDGDTGDLVGMVDTPELAAAICDAMNAAAKKAAAPPGVEGRQ